MWNRFGIPLVPLDAYGIALLRLRIPANRNPFEVCHRIIISMGHAFDNRLFYCSAVIFNIV